MSPATSPICVWNFGRYADETPPPQPSPAAREREFNTPSPAERGRVGEGVPMSDNPFSEPDDSDRTVIRPTPGGRSAAPRQTSAQPAFRHAPPEPIAGDGAENVSFGLNPLI